MSVAWHLCLRHHQPRHRGHHDESVQDDRPHHAWPGVAPSPWRVNKQWDSIPGASQSMWDVGMRAYVLPLNAPSRRIVQALRATFGEGRAQRPCHPCQLEGRQHRAGDLGPWNCLCASERVIGRHALRRMTQSHQRYEQYENHEEWSYSTNLTWAI